MLSRWASRMRRVLIGALVAATMCVVLTQPAAAATKPKIGLVSLYGGEFSSVQATVWGAVGVVICVSHTCARAERLASGRWLMGGDRAPTDAPRPTSARDRVRCQRHWRPRVRPGGNHHRRRPRQTALAQRPMPDSRRRA
jgi:hypothetical protein